MFRVAIDVGGTFTDLCALNEVTGEIVLGKGLTTAHDFSEGVVNTFKSSGIRGEDVTRFVGTGSTLVINAIIERKGVKTALITTKGFRDVLEIQRSNRPDMYNYSYRKPVPFVPRYLRFEVLERIASDGSVVLKLAKKSVLEALRKARSYGAESIAICLYNSYANPDHEKEVAKIARGHFKYVSSSHEITREWREYERMNTTVLDAYVKPLLETYLKDLEMKMRELGIRIPIHVIQSNGGVAVLEKARETPILQVESGPAGGVIGARELGVAVGESNVISLDVGGTTAKASLVENGRIRLNPDYRVERTPTYAGYPVKTPVVDIVEIGAGGGSIAWIDDVGSLKVGPRSAGAYPGPACYGKGGEQPTVTDAFVVSGILNPEYFLGGEIRLDKHAAEKAVAKISEHFGTSVEEAAAGIIKVAAGNMVNLLRLVSVARGHDPRDFTLVAFGGAGPMFATLLARELQVSKTVIPRIPGVFSAWGMLMTDLRHDFKMTRVMKLDDAHIDILNNLFNTLEEEGRQVLTAQGINEVDMYFVRTLDLRYYGQEHTVSIEVPSGMFNRGLIQEITERFHKAHEKEYTFRLDSPVEVVNLHLAAFAKVSKPRIAVLQGDTQDFEEASKGYRRAYLPGVGFTEVPVYEREKLPIGNTKQGPAIIEEKTSTTLVMPGDTFKIDNFGNIVIRYGGVD
ncbi:Acetophenone carboxylase gamma subunit [archaeon HR01]|nr:Acetophenone carboxylase gamma subunit [archaeon HR01]